jgi:hypothetical protein
LARIELEDRDAPFQAKVDLSDPRQCLKRLTQRRLFFCFEIRDRKYGGFCAHLALLVFEFDKTFFNSQLPSESLGWMV